MGIGVKTPDPQKTARHRRRGIPPVIVNTRESRHFKISQTENGQYVD